MQNTALNPHTGGVVILDYGSQYTQLIARRCRELGFYSVVLAANASLERIQGHSPKAIILSGGPSSVYDPGAPALAAGFLEWQIRNRISVLGICYGMQLLAHELGGKVHSAKVREYGRQTIELSSDGVLHSKLWPKMLEAEVKSVHSPSDASSTTRQVWMSHGDEIDRLPQGFILTARSHAGAPAIIESPRDYRYAIQFHPEVTHSEGGSELLKNFLGVCAGIKPTWNMSSIKQEQISAIRAMVGEHDQVICALSGGVDSTVAATLVHQAIGDRLHCVFVDTGLLRFEEQTRVMALFNEQLHLPVECVNASARFLGELKGIEDPEKKRKIIGAEFIRVFDQYAQALSKKLGSESAVKFLVQGTLYPDVIESSPAPSAAEGEVSSTTGGSAKKHSHTIKSHHNVGGLPKDLKFKLIEPLRDLFKDEVRALGKELGVPEAFLKRHPFPGPGLAVRVMGEITEERLEILKQVDEIFIREIQVAGLYDKIWQAFAVFLPIRTVGVQGDGRTHDYVVALRAVTSSDGMTADWYPFESKFLAHVSSTICNQVRGVSRVVYDISSKPPATIEWE